MSEALNEILSIKFLIINVAISIAVSIVANLLTDRLKSALSISNSLPPALIYGLQLVGLAALAGAILMAPQFMRYFGVVLCVSVGLSFILIPHSAIWPRDPRTGFAGTLDRMQIPRLFYYFTGLMMLLFPAFV